MGSLPHPGSCTRNATRVSSLAQAAPLCCPDLGHSRPRSVPCSVRGAGASPQLPGLRIGSKSFSSTPGIHPLLPLHLQLFQQEPFLILH